MAELLTNLLFEPKGKHNPQVAYNIKDTVMSADGGQVYFALKAVPIGIQLNNTEYWKLQIDLSETKADMEAATDAANAAAEDASQLSEQVEQISEDVDRLSEGKVSYEYMRGNNLFDESTMVLGSWWTKSGLASNQYTSGYRACEVDVTGISTITIFAKSTNDTVHPYFYNYFTVDADGIVSNAVVVEAYYIKTLNLPEGTVKVRFNINAAVDKVFTVMVNEGDTALPYEPYELRKVFPGEVDLENIKAQINNASKPRIVLGDKFVAVVGDTLQVFFDSIIEGNYSDKVLKFNCAKGKNYPRYWEFQPTSADVGEYKVEVALFDSNGNSIAEASSTLKVVAAANPAEVKHVLCVGDSTMEFGHIPIEASRRVKGTNGVAVSPAPLSLSNIAFVGRKQNDDNSVGWEGTGGWGYKTYNNSGDTAIRFTVSAADNLNIGAVYQVGNFKLTISEINVTGGVGTIRCLFYYATPYTSAWDSTAQTGTMTLFAGEGQTTVNFSAWKKETYQPFWDVANNKWDITAYAETYCGGKIDAICVLLGINNLINAEPYNNTLDIVDGAKTFCRNVHGQLPNCKILVSTVPLASVNGGIAANYGASTASGMYNANGLNHKVHTYNAAIIEAMRNAEFAGYVTVVPSHAQFDAENGYPITTKALNTRVTEMEILQTNGVHPRNEGYWQISDALAFRAVLGALS